jgi:hydroxymethylglutaryl-CoA synthase
MAIEASQNAFNRKKIDKSKIGAVYCGSESPVYAVKPNASMVGGALGIGNDYTSADVEFACKAGTASMQMAFGLAKSGFIDYGIAIGSDTAQSEPGDVLEYTAASGAASIIIGSKKDEVIAELESMHSISSDTPDFWRRNMQLHPRHAERFTGQPAYFKHVVECTKKIMKKSGIKASQISHAIFHTPNGKFPQRAAQMLGFPKEKVQDNLIVSKIGNTYSAASMLVLTKILDSAKPEERILMTSFGSGAGSDSFIFRVTKNIRNLSKAKTTSEYIGSKKYVNYATYLKLTGQIK